MSSDQRASGGRGRRILLWVLAVLFMAFAAVYQRLTGPTHPLRVSYEVAGETYSGRLIRNHVTDEDAAVTIPAPEAPVAAALQYKRLGTEDPFTALPMKVVDGQLVGHLPAQPPAGKLEYHLVLTEVDRSIRVPADAGENVIIRFKGHVPLWVLLPHVIVMFFSILLGVRTGFAAMFSPGETGRLTVITIIGLTLGGMILGPIVQKLAFGELWTGWPNGKDLTDNKTLVMWGVWLLAGGALLLWQRTRPGRARLAVVVAAVVMSAVYLIPHSLRGSTLDYDKLDQGASPTEAIKTG